jgi:probable rRNA maturation factor
MDRQRAIPRAKAACKRAAEAVLPDQQVVVALVDDATMARLHKQFLGKPGPTDVLSFPHGEIVVSADTARREAEAREIPPLSELVLYVVHGALHLKGYDDKRPKDKARMRAAERRVLNRLGHGDVFAARPQREKKSRRPADKKRR